MTNVHTAEASAGASSELKDLYRELILDHARQPRHFGSLTDATHVAEGVNPLCGDRLKLYLKLNSDAHIEDASFEGIGCAISLASASLLTETVIGKPLDDALASGRTVIGRLTGDAAARSAPSEKLAALEGVKEFPMRVKCATLAWRALQSAADGSMKPVTTE